LRHHEAISQPESGWRFQQWLVTAAKRTLDDKKDNCDRRNRELMIDSAIMRAHQHAADARKELNRRVPKAWAARSGLSIRQQNPSSHPQNPHGYGVEFYKECNSSNAAAQLSYPQP